MSELGNAEIRGVYKQVSWDPDCMKTQHASRRERGFSKRHFQICGVSSCRLFSSYLSPVMVPRFVAVVQLIVSLPKLVVRMCCFAAKTTNAENAKDLVPFYCCTIPVKDDCKYHWNSDAVQQRKEQRQRIQHVVDPCPTLDFGIKVHIGFPVLFLVAGKDLKCCAGAIQVCELEHHDQ